MEDAKLREKVVEALENVEAIWEEVEPRLVMMSEGLEKAMDSNLPSNIPGHTSVNPIKPEVDDFIAFVLDIRDSSSHLLQAISRHNGKPVKASQLKRVLYEVTAVNTIGSIITEEKNGKITEFLGDGFLALYKVSDEDKGNVYKAHNAAKGCLRAIKEIVNPILEERYNLPELKVGIGLAYSQAIITVMGYGDNLHPKALGDCIFRASKMANDKTNINSMRVDEKLKLFWPKEKNGSLKFSLFSQERGFKEYIIAKNEKH